MTPLKLTTFRLDDAMMAKLQEIREKVGIPVSEQVRRALQQWIDEHEASTRKVKKKR